MEKGLKSPLRYPGGKSKAIKFLQDYFPKNFKEYREPFFGGGSVGLYLAQYYQQKNIQYYANDLNYDVYCFWNTLKIQDIKQKSRNGRELYKMLLERRESNLSDFQRAIDFFILNRITFSGAIE